MADVTKRETVVGATGPGSRTLTYPKALNELLGTKFKIVSGYPGGNEITLALERGEVEGYCGWALGSIMTRAPDWLRDGKITAARAVHAGEIRSAERAAGDAISSPPRPARRAIEFLAADSVLAWPLVAPPDMPAERVDELRTAFDAMMKDPQLLAEAATQGTRYRSGKRRRDCGAGRAPLWHAAGGSRSGSEDQRFPLTGLSRNCRLAKMNAGALEWKHVVNATSQGTCNAFAVQLICRRRPHQRLGACRDLVHAARQRRGPGQISRQAHSRGGWIFGGQRGRSGVPHHRREAHRELETAVHHREPPGAGGGLAAQSVAKAAPDGYTLLTVSAAHVILPAISVTKLYDAQDFTAAPPPSAFPTCWW